MVLTQQFYFPFCFKITHHVVFDEMHEHDIVTWGAIIQGYASNGFPMEALDLFLKMQRENFKG